MGNTSGRTRFLQTLCKNYCNPFFPGMKESFCKTEGFFEKFFDSFPRNAKDLSRPTPEKGKHRPQ